MAQASYIAGLTPAMRAALGTAPPARLGEFGARHLPGLSGLYHGATLNALVRHGLATRDYLGDDEYDYFLTTVGLEARDELRQRVDEKLAAHGFTRGPFAGSQLYDNPDEGGTCTRAGAMRRTGVRW